MSTMCMTRVVFSRFQEGMTEYNPSLVPADNSCTHLWLDCNLCMARFGFYTKENRHLEKSFAISQKDKVKKSHMIACHPDVVSSRGARTGEYRVRVLSS